MKILVTGANGFVGEVLCRKLVERGFEAKGAVRREETPLAPGVEKIVVGSIDASTDWSNALKGVDCVIHLAARVHVMHEKSADPLAEFRKVNVAGTERLARSAAKAGVKRLVYVSSIKVNGEATKREPFTEQNAPNPQDPYGISKWEAEESLRSISEKTGLEAVIVRPPLVYGPGVGGNFIRMLDWMEKGIPLPLGAVKNRRSMIHVENLADAMILCSTHPDAKNETFLVSDSESVSTPDLARTLSEKMGKRVSIMPFPVSLLHFLGKLAGKSAEIERLTGSLEIDSSKIRRKLGWNSPFPLDRGLAETILWFQTRN